MRLHLLVWGHVIFMPKYGHCDVSQVTWAVCLILIGRENFCCAVIGQYLLEPPILLTLIWNFFEFVVDFILLTLFRPSHPPPLGKKLNNSKTVQVMTTKLKIDLDWIIGSKYDKEGNRPICKLENTQFNNVYLVVLCFPDS